MGRIVNGRGYVTEHIKVGSIRKVFLHDKCYKEQVVFEKGKVIIGNEKLNYYIYPLLPKPFYYAETALEFSENLLLNNLFLDIDKQRIVIFSGDTRRLSEGIKWYIKNTDRIGDENTKYDFGSGKLKIIKISNDKSMYMSPLILSILLEALWRVDLTDEERVSLVVIGLARGGLLEKVIEASIEMFFGEQRIAISPFDRFIHFPVLSTNGKISLQKSGVFFTGRDYYAKVSPWEIDFSRKKIKLSRLIELDVREGKINTVKLFKTEGVEIPYVVLIPGEGTIEYIKKTFSVNSRELDTILHGNFGRELEKETLKSLPVRFTNIEGLVSLWLEMLNLGWGYLRVSEVADGKVKKIQTTGLCKIKKRNFPSKKLHDINNATALFLIPEDFAIPMIYPRLASIKRTSVANSLYELWLYEKTPKSGVVLESADGYSGVKEYFDGDNQLTYVSPLKVLLGNLKDDELFKIAFFGLSTSYLSWLVAESLQKKNKKKWVGFFGEYLLPLFLELFHVETVLEDGYYQADESFPIGLLFFPREKENDQLITNAHRWSFGSFNGIRKGMLREEGLWYSFKAPPRFVEKMYVLGIVNLLTFIRNVFVGYWNSLNNKSLLDKYSKHWFFRGIFITTEVDQIIEFVLERLEIIIPVFNNQIIKALEPDDGCQLFNYGDSKSSEIVYWTYKVVYEYSSFPADMYLVLSDGRKLKIYKTVL